MEPEIWLPVDAVLFQLRLKAAREAIIESVRTKTESRALRAEAAQIVEQSLALALLDEARPPIAAFAWLDVVVAAIVVLVLAIKQIFAGQRRFWLVVVGTCGVGVSLGLPLYLYLEPESAPHTE